VNVTRDDRTSRAASYAVATLGLLLLLVALPLYLAGGLIAPVWAVGVLLLTWLSLFVLGIKWFAKHPYRVLLLPFAAAAIWFAVMSAGGAFLGWTA